MGSLLGGLSVQRSSCDGACGCGGTCGGGGAEQAKDPDELIAEGAAPVQRLASPATGTRGGGPRPPLHLLPALQSGAGNAAVAQLLHQPAPVQRLGLEDLLPDWITGAIFGAKDKAAGDAAKAHQQGQDAEHRAEKEADTAAAKVDAEIPKLHQEAEKTRGQAEQKMASGQQSVAKGKADMDKATAKAAKDLEQAAAKTDKANEGKQLLAGEAPSCSISKVMNAAEKTADIIGKPFGIKGADLLKKVGAVVSKIGQNIKDGL
jgi:hypothetical protein